MSLRKLLVGVFLAALLLPTLGVAGIHAHGSAAASNYPQAVVNAGAQVAWDTRTTCGYGVAALSPASGFSGTGLSKSAPNFEINTAATNTFNNIDLTGWLLWTYGGGTTNITNAKFLCNAGVSGSCNSGSVGFINQGYDSGQSPRLGAALAITNATIDGTGRANFQQLMQPAGSGVTVSALTLNGSCLTNAPQDYISTGIWATLSMTGDFLTAQGTQGSPGDHNEMVHFYGTSASFTNVRFDGSIGGVSVGTNVLLFLDPSVTATGSITTTTVTFTTDPQTLFVGEAITGGAAANTTITGGISQWNGTTATATVSISQTVTTRTLTMLDSPRQTVTVSHSVFNTNQAIFYVIQAGGTITIDHSVFKAGSTGHYVYPGNPNCVDGGNNYDIDTAALIPNVCTA